MLKGEIKTYLIPRRRGEAKEGGRLPITASFFLWLIY